MVADEVRTKACASVRESQQENGFKDHDPPLDRVQFGQAEASTTRLLTPRSGVSGSIRGEA